MALIHRQDVIREFIDGEARARGFLLAYLGLTQGYILLPEYESFEGYADFYMMSGLVRQSGMVYNYIVEVKCVRCDTPDADATLLKRDTAEQLHCYAGGGKVARTKGNTQFGLIALVSKGWELVALEKLTSRANCENASGA